MIVKSINGTSYTLRDWINNQEFSLMAEGQMLMMKITGKICNWNDARIKKINDKDKDGKPSKDKIELTRIMIEEGITIAYGKLKALAAQTIIISPKVEDYALLPRDIMLAAETQVEKLFIASQPKPTENEAKLKK